MKKTLLLGIVGVMALSSCNTTSKTPKTELDSVAYALGLDIGQSVKNIDKNLDIDMLAQAMKDVINETEKMTPQEIQEFLNEYFSVRKPAKALKESEDFLAKKEKEANVHKTESGLLYEIIQEGGVKATNDADTVVVLYTGTLPDGTVFDSTDNRDGEPISFPLNGVIRAWTEGMKLVGEGGKIRLYAHPDLAYGSRGASQLIGPNQALVFDVELVEVKPVAEQED